MSDTQLRCFGLICGAGIYAAWFGATGFTVGMTFSALVIFMWDAIAGATQ